jgi:hypothetical protein
MMLMGRYFGCSAIPQWFEVGQLQSEVYLILTIFMNSLYAHAQVIIVIVLIDVSLLVLFFILVAVVGIEPGTL